MKEINTEEITEEVARLCQTANHMLDEDVITAYQEAYDNEENPVAKQILEYLSENAELASRKQVAVCQDTGMTVVFIELGQDVKIVGGDLYQAINQGVREGYEQGYLRKSVVYDPIFNRSNTSDNTPAVIHTELVPGDELKLTVAPKGFGSENMSQMKLLKPTEGKAGVKQFILKAVKEAGANPCPPIVVGVGVGGTIEKAAMLSKKSLLRPIGSQNPEPDIRDFEQELLAEINQLGIGPQGFGGKTTAFDVNIETYPTHIAGLPVVVNINCHVARHKSVVL